MASNVTAEREHSNKLNDSDWSDIVGYLEKMSQDQIKQLGGELGLGIFKLDMMKTLPDDMVKAWLHKEDKVNEKCGDPLTWEELVQALQKLGQNGIAADIIRDKCRQTESASKLPAQHNEDLPLTVKNHHAALCHILKSHATKWREIGLQLGFLPGDLDNIQAAPLLLQTAPVSWMNAMLEKFLKDTEGGGAMMHVLETALNKAGLGMTAFQLRDDVQRLLVQGVPCKQNLSPVEKYAKRLRDLYSKRKMPDYLKGRQLRTANFVSLALISREGVSKEEMDEFTRSTVNEGDVDAICKRKAPLEMTNIGKLKTGLLATCMLFQGGPGVGKTTLAWNLCREWECCQLFQEYSLMVFIPLRRKAIRIATEVKDLFSIGNADSKTKEAICDEVLNNQGESLLLVLDGYDELPADVQQDSMIADIVSGELLPKASVLITSRPSICDKLTDKCRQRDENFQHIEVLGFTKDKINTYIEDNVRDSKQLKQFYEYLSSHQKIYTMMYNPLQCALTVEVCKKMFKDGSGLPNTRTRLYETNILMTMSREHLLDRNNSLRKLPQALRENFVELCHLAYSGILKRQIIFEDVSEEIEKIGLLVCEPEMDSVLPSSENYNFFHLTIQEFCAAYYICSLPEWQQQEEMKHHCRKDQFREVVIFACGLSDNPERLVDIVYDSCVMQGIRSEHFTDEDHLLLLHCAFESQCTDTCTMLVEKCLSAFEFNGQELTPSDMSAIGFLICKSEQRINELVLCQCWCGDSGVKALIDQCYHTLEHSSLSIEQINLSTNNISDDGAKYLSEVLKYCPELQTLNLSGNNIGNDGAKCLTEGLICCPKLQRLNLSRNNIGDDGAKYLSEGLKYWPELKLLDLSWIKISDSGAKCLCRGLKYCLELQTLLVLWNLLSYDGKATLAMVRDKINSKRGPQEHKLKIYF